MNAETGGDAISALARRFCCNQDCLLKCRLIDVAMSVSRSARDEISNMSRKEKKCYIRQKVESCCIVGKKGTNFIYSWQIGLGSLQAKVCRNRFLLTYCISDTWLENLCKSIKTGVVNSEKKLSDLTPPALVSYVSQLLTYAYAKGVALDKKQRASLHIPNTVASMNCYSWFDFYFDMVGDSIPNSDGEIHLEPVWSKDIYAEYSFFMEQSGLEVLESTQFAAIWKLCYPHVRIREFKAVTGKCDTCAKLSALRREKRDVASRQELTHLHYLHRTTYMGERMVYGEHIINATQMPKHYLSIISDGMAQSHCSLPWMGNLAMFKNCLDQHIQGVLLHGRGMRLYRTFHNINNQANLQIHTFLLSLESVFRKEGKLPDTIYHQIDGGTENTAKVCYAVMELLIIRGLTKKIILTRLLVGHTHADIDAKFGRLWKEIRSRHVNTQDAYRELMVRCLSMSGVYVAEVVDIFVVPNYKELLTPCLDKKFSKYAKEDYTQLVFTFEAVEPSDDFPFGCKTMYKAYAQDTVIEIVPDASCILGLRPRTVHNKFHPAETDKAVAGMYLLKKLPDCVNGIKPTEFVAGSRASFVKTLECIDTNFPKTTSVNADWHRWDREVVPQSDDVLEHLEKHPEHFRLPFADILFSSTPFVPGEFVSFRTSEANSFEVTHATESVQWDNRQQRSTHALLPRSDGDGNLLPLPGLDEPQQVEGTSNTTKPTQKKKKSKKASVDPSANKPAVKRPRTQLYQRTSSASTGPPPTSSAAPAPTGPPPTSSAAPAPTGPPPTSSAAPAPTGPPPTSVAPRGAARAKKRAKRNYDGDDSDDSSYSESKSDGNNNRKQLSKPSTNKSVHRDDRDDDGEHSAGGAHSGRCSTQVVGLGIKTRRHTAKVPSRASSANHSDAVTKSSRKHATAAKRHKDSIRDSSDCDSSASASGHSDSSDSSDSSGGLLIDDSSTRSAEIAGRGRKSSRHTSKVSAGQSAAAEKVREQETSDSEYYFKDSKPASTGPHIASQRSAVTASSLTRTAAERSDNDTVDSDDGIATAGAEEPDVTDTESVDRCGFYTVKRKFTNDTCAQFSSAALHRRFKFHKPHFMELQHPYISTEAAKKMGTGCIVAVVRRRNDTTLCYKFYDCDIFRVTSTNIVWFYVPCDYLFFAEIRRATLVPKHLSYKDGFYAHNLLGRKIVKQFDSGFFRGNLLQYRADTLLYRVVYEDDDYEDLTLKEVLPLLR